LVLFVKGGRWLIVNAIDAVVLEDDLVNGEAVKFRMGGLKGLCEGSFS
jgi:hypothetical protein